MTAVEDPAAAAADRCSECEAGGDEAEVMLGRD
jgi:hypothetical protein